MPILHAPDSPDTRTTGRRQSGLALEEKSSGMRNPELRSLVFLTASEEDFQTVARLLAPAEIRVHHVSVLEQAHFLLSITSAHVLLTDTTFQDGTWEAARKMVADFHPRVSVVLAATNADERFWIHVLEQGVYDLVLKPFAAEELVRILENAHVHALCRNRVGHGGGGGVFW